MATNAAGRAIAAGFNPLASGAVQINVTAAVQGQTMAATITQTNVLTAAQAANGAGVGAGGGGGGGLSTAATTAIVGAAAAAPVGLALGSGGEEAPGDPRGCNLELLNLSASWVGAATIQIACKPREIAADRRCPALCDLVEWQRRA